jgi:hypothetical protein
MRGSFHAGGLAESPLTAALSERAMLVSSPHAGEGAYLGLHRYSLNLIPR